MDITVNTTKGGLGGHILRRSIHVSMAALPLLYYQYGVIFASRLGFSSRVLLLVLLLGLCALEGMRLWFGVICIGQRPYETKRVSSFTFGAFGIIVVLLCTQQMYAIPIIFSCALVDPLMGELRELLPYYLTAIIGMLTVWGIWTMCHWYLSTPELLAYVMGPLIVLLEKPNYYWIDDNLLMQLVPLCIVRMLYH